MLSLKNRFHGHNSVRRVYRQGRPVRSSLFGMHINTGDRVKSTKVAVVVSKKVHKSAVKRNRIRRRVYESMRLLLPRISKPSEIVVTIYSEDVIGLPDVELKKSIEEALAKTKLLEP